MLTKPARTWIRDTMKNAAVNRAMRGTSSSRMRQALKTNSATPTAPPPSHHGAASNPSLMCTAQSKLFLVLDVDPQRQPLAKWIRVALVFAHAAVALGREAPPTRLGKSECKDAIGDE